MMKKFFKNSALLTGIVLSFSACTKDYTTNFENGYNKNDYEDSINLSLDTNRFKIDYSKYTQARLFPGLMATSEPRLENYKVSLDLTYVDVNSADLRISVTPGNWLSTGMYAPAGELIVIDVPEGVYGLTAMIGAWTDNLKDVEFPKRDPLIFSQKVLFPGKNYMRNLYGGLVYILPERPLGKIIDVKFSGVAKAPSFKLGEITDDQWLDLVAKSTVPWFELEGEKIIFTLETSKLKTYPLTKPTELMQTWDKHIKEAYWDWTGMVEGAVDLKNRAPFNKWRIVHDINPSVGAQHSGFPVVATNTMEYFRQATSIESVKFQNWGTYHELGHNMQQGSTWNFAGNGEVTNNLFSFKVAKINGSQHTKIAEIWNKGIAQAYIGDAAKTWADMEKNAKYKDNHNDIKLIMYAQIFEKYGYDFMTYIYKRARSARFTSANDQSKIDFFYEALSEFTHIDMEPFLKVGWGLTVSSISKKYVSEELNLPLLNKSVWLYNPVNKTGGEEIFYSELPKTGWIATASNNQNTVDYVPAKMIDGNLSTFWAACWNTTCTGAAVGSPSWEVVLQTGANAVNAKGIVFSQRQVVNNSNHAKIVNIKVSSDNLTWTDMGNRNLTRDLTKQYLFFDNTSKTTSNFKYVKLTILKSNLYVPTDFASIAELGLF